MTAKRPNLLIPGYHRFLRKDRGTSTITYSVEDAITCSRRGANRAFPVIATIPIPEKKERLVDVMAITFCDHIRVFRSARWASQMVDNSLK